MAVDIEPLLESLSALAPHFGRVRADIEAIVARARQGDYRGSMQSARLVLEALLRSLVAEDLKQTPGKGMLEELLARFRQQANRGLIPTNVLAHMGTVQAWGNLSMHDHADRLDATAVHVGQGDVVASLNSMVTILTWYGDRKGLTPATGLGPGSGGTSATQPFELGRVVGGRYRLEARLAAGGMGEVFRATHVELHRPLALKVMRPELSADAHFVERFRREAMTASSLGHPNIVDIIDSGSEGGQFYFVMEFLDGRTLSRLIADGPMAPAVALDLCAQMAGALEVAHRSGVVHRDLKPDNVIVLERGGGLLAKLVDFGIAKMVAPVDGKRTTHGVIIGTPQYMAPEQAAGLAVDARTDVYALGLILYEALVGAPPFTAETAALLMSAHIADVAPALPRRFPSRLRTLVARMLAKSPDARPQTMREVLDTLGAVSVGASRRAPAVIAAAAVALALVAGAVVWQRGPPPVPTAEAAHVDDAPRAAPPAPGPGQEAVVAVEPPAATPEVTAADAGVPDEVAAGAAPAAVATPPALLLRRPPKKAPPTARRAPKTPEAPAKPPPLLPAGDGL